MASYPVRAAATRYRLSQLQEPLADRGILLEVRPFLDDAGMRQLYGDDTVRKVAAVGRGLWRRAGDVFHLRNFDVAIVQREAMLVGPPIAERLVGSLGGHPWVLDVDDPIWLPEQSLVPSLLSTLRRWPGKVDWLMGHATLVSCGNRFLADYVTNLGLRARVVPNGIDTARFRRTPRPARTGRPPTVGWIGSHSTYPYLESVLPSLQEVRRRLAFRMSVIGSGRRTVPIDGISVDVRDFGPNREATDFTSLDIGLYPLFDDLWAAGKSGLKAIQYMAAGVPYIASPVGVVAEMGVLGTTHLFASTSADWEAALTTLLEDSELRAQMGQSGRREAEVHHSIGRSADAFAAVLREAAGW